MFRSLRHRNVRLFFGGLIVSNVGSWMQMTALSVVVYDLTGRAIDTGFVLFCQFLPMLVLGTWAGAVADRTSKRKMAVVTQSLQAVQALTLGVVTLAGAASLPVVYGLTLVLGVVAAFDNPARRGFVIEMVQPDEITNAISLNTAVMTGSRVVGPALAALLAEPVGAGSLFIINGLTFTALIWALLGVDRSQLYESPPAKRGGTPVRDALRFVVDDRRILVVYVVFTLVGTFAFNYSVSLLKLSDDRFDNANLYGVLLAVAGAGSLLGSLLTAARQRVSTNWLFGHAVLLAVASLALAWAPSVPAAVLLSLPVGLGGAAFIAAHNAIVQQESPPDMRGRLLALGAVAFLGTVPVGAPITGWIADAVSAEWSLAYGSVVALLSVAWALVARHRLRWAFVPADQNERSSVLSDGGDAAGVVP
jgi:MFS family permease